MLDIKYIQDHILEVQTNIRNRNMNADAEAVVALYEQRNSLIKDLDDLRSKRNENAQKMKNPLSAEQRQILIQEGKEIKERIPHLESELENVEKKYKNEWAKIPNIVHPKVPIGNLDTDNEELMRWGTPRTFSFRPRDHVELGNILDIIDFEAGTKVSGTKFYYLKNEGVFLELGLIRYVLDILVGHGFTPVITPDIAKEDIVSGVGFTPRGAESNIYALEDTGTCLIGTAEITLGGYHSDEVLEETSLPLFYAGLSHCFRREAGAAGQFSKGLYRVHQFTKVEMFVYCTPKQSDDLHERLRTIEEEIFRGLEIPYRVVETCTGDLSAPAYRKFDIEAWMPGRGSGEYGEVTSTSNCTDYQARRLNCKIKDAEGKRFFAHMLNGTAIAVSRGIISILENNQQEDGSVIMPAKLVPYLGFDRILPRRS